MTIRARHRARTAASFGTAPGWPRSSSPRAAQEATEETVIKVRGIATADPRAPGGVEITRPVISPLSEPAAPPPFGLYRPTLALRRGHRMKHSPTNLS
jgi:nondiscriminating aspartyl-tRNA synthetase